MTSGTLTMGFNKAKSNQRLHSISPQISLLYLRPPQVLPCSTFKTSTRLKI